MMCNRKLKLAVLVALSMVASLLAAPPGRAQVPAESVTVANPGFEEAEGDVAISWTWQDLPGGAHLR